MSMSLRKRWNSARAVVFVYALLAIFVSGALRADDPVVTPGKTQRLFWKVSSPTTEVYFLGSIHLASKDFYPLPPEIEAAFAKSDALLVEADINKVDEASAMKVMLSGMYAQGDSLDKHISPATMKSLTAFCDENKLPMVAITMMKPVLAAMTVESLVISKLGMTAEMGIDVHFLKQAADAKKKIVELESVDGQLALLMGLDDALADKWLAETLKDNSNLEMDKIIKAWQTGDAKSIEKLMVEDDKNDPDAQKLSDLLIYKRNDEMVKKIETLLKGNEKAFVVVGSAHLLGEKGIIKQLEKDKFKVEVPELTSPPAAPATRPGN